MAATEPASELCVMKKHVHLTREAQNDPNEWQRGKQHQRQTLV